MAWLRGGTLREGADAVAVCREQFFESVEAMLPAWGELTSRETQVAVSEAKVQLQALQLGKDGAHAQLENIWKVHVEVNHRDRQLHITKADALEKETLQISDAEMCLSLPSLAQEVAKRTTGIAPDQLVEPLRELCMTGCAESAKEVKDKDVEPGERSDEQIDTTLEGDPLMEQVISVRLLGGDALGSYKVATVKTVAQLKSRVFKEAHFPVSQQQVTYGDQILPDVQREMVLELQLLLISPSCCRVAFRMRPPNQREAELPVVWRADTVEAQVSLVDSSAWHGRRAPEFI
eukprot:symbB.v1.2.037385.t3/scaffold5505.1/size26367/1